VCRLFGFRSALPASGWFVDDDAYVVKSATPAHACERFKRVSTRLLSQTFIGHVRRATVGHVDPMNAHPFRHGRWLFAHNGTVFGFEGMRGWVEERILPPLRPQILGDTDSEHLFYFLLSMMAQAGVDPNGRVPSEARAVAGALRQALHPLDAEARRRGLDRPITNLLLTDGRSFVAHRAGMPLYLCARKAADGASIEELLVASERIGADDAEWDEVPDGATVVLDQRFVLAIHPPTEGWVTPPVPKHYLPPGEQPTLVRRRHTA
jgi:glutamine amidotransferase